jgi:formate dehydrogenase major subunit
VNSPRREYRVKYRRPYAREWESLDLDTAMDMIADRVIETRAQTWEQETDDGKPLHRTRGFAFLGGATLDSEENYLIKKGFSALGAVSIENQARI